MRTISVEATTIQELLGTQSGIKEIQSEFIASKGGTVEFNERVQAGLDLEWADADIDKEIARATTIFYKENNIPCLLAYQIQGFFKSAASALRKADPHEYISSQLSAHKKVIDTIIFVEPDIIPMKHAVMGICERALRVETARGPRICLARSEKIEAGAVFHFDVRMLDSSMYDYVVEWLNYGCHYGIGQWRNSGKGKFVYRITADTGPTVSYKKTVPGAPRAARVIRPKRPSTKKNDKK